METIVPTLISGRRRSTARAGLAVALALAGAPVVACGAQHARRPAPAPVRRPPPPPLVSTASGRLLVFFKETIGSDPEASQLTVDRNGTAMALTTLGGPGGEHRQYFTLSSKQLRRLRSLVTHTRLGYTHCCRANFFVYFVSAHGHSWRLAQGFVPAAMRPLIGDLGAMTYAHTTYNGPSG